MLHAISEAVLSMSPGYKTIHPKGMSITCTLGGAFEARVQPKGIHITARCHEPRKPRDLGTAHLYLVLTSNVTICFDKNTTVAIVSCVSRLSCG